MKQLLIMSIVLNVCLLFKPLILKLVLNVKKRLKPFKSGSETDIAFKVMLTDVEITKKVNSVLKSIENLKRAAKAGEKLSNKKGSLIRTSKSLREVIQLNYKITDEDEVIWISKWCIRNHRKLTQPIRIYDDAELELINNKN